MTAQDPQLPPILPNANTAKINSPRLEDYRIPTSPGYAIPKDRYLMSAPELGGVSAILAEFDAAARSDQFSLALQKLIRCRENVVPDLLERLESDEVSVSKKAAIALGYMRSPSAILPLIAAAKNPQRQIHWQAAAALSWIGSAEAISALVKLLRDHSIQVQSASAKALARASLPAVSPLVEALKTCDDAVKVHAAHSLGQISSPLAVTALIEALGNSSKPVRLESAWALGQIKSPLSANALAHLLTDNDISVQSQAVHALKNIGASAIRPVANMLTNPSSHTRSVAARTLGNIGMEEVVPLLAQVLRQDEYAYVRCDAALALGEIGTYDAVFHLSQSARDSDRSVRSAVLRALVQINSLEAQEALHTIKNTLVGIPNFSVSNFKKNNNDDSDFTIIQ